jgi:ABC-2 type transport system permease protein
MTTTQPPTTQPPITRPPARTGTTDVSALQTALVAGGRPPRPGAFTVSIAFGHRALLKIKHVPEQLFDVTVFPVMTTLMFTYLFGGAVAGSVDSYVQYLLPGVLVQTIMLITMYTGVALNTDITKGVFDRFRSMPIWRPSALVWCPARRRGPFAIASTIIVVHRPGDRLPAGGGCGVLAGVARLLVFAFSLAGSGPARP